MKIIFSQSSGYKYVKLINNPYYTDATNRVGRLQEFEKLRMMVINLAPDFFQNSAESYGEINKVFPQKMGYSLTPEMVEDFLNRLLEHLEDKKMSQEIVELNEGVYEFPVEKTMNQKETERRVREIGEFIVKNNPQIFEKPKAWALRSGLEGKEIPVFLPFNDKLVIMRIKSIENQGLNFKGDIVSVYDPRENRMVFLTEDIEQFDPSYSYIKSFGGRFLMDANDIKKAEDTLKKAKIAY